MRRASFLAAAFALLTACARFTGGGSGEAASATVLVTPDSALRAARTTLVQEGWAVNRLADGTLATEPRDMPAGAGNQGAAERWMVQVASEPLFRMSGSKVIVAGFIIPASAEQPVDSVTISRAVPITSGHRTMWREVRGLTDRIARAAGRAR